MRCVNCKNCIGTWASEAEKIGIHYVCKIGNEYELVEECVANDDNLGCDLFVEDCNDDFTART